MSKLIRHTFTSVLIFCLAAGHEMLLSQTFNRPVPPVILPYEFVQNDSSGHGCYLLAPYKANGYMQSDFIHPYPLILDKDGYVLWYCPIDSGNVFNFNFNEHLQRYTYIHAFSPNYMEYIVMNDVLVQTDTFTTINGVLPDSHEFEILSNGNVLLAGKKDSIMDLSAYTFNGVPGSSTAHVRGFVVQEFDPQHHLVFEWNSNDHIFPTESFPAFYGYNPADFDYCHGNAIEQDYDGNLLISFRHLNAVYKIDHITGETIWRLGGKSSDFTFPNDYKFSGQHDIRHLVNGNYSVFDNGNSHSPKRSRGVEYHLDTTAMTATKVWEYLPSPTFFASAMGNHQTTNDRHHLLSYGLVFRPKPSVQLTDDYGNLLTEINLMDSVQTYRTHLASPQQVFPRPVISCSTGINGIFLAAPAGYTRYIWSTGDTTAAIPVTQTGVYQCWVNYGCGMLGSQPYFVTDLNNVCGQSGISNLTESERKDSFEFFDITGRQVLPFKNGIYICRDINGNGKLRYIRSDEIR